MTANERSDPSCLTFATGLNSRQSGDWTQRGGDELPRSRRQAAPTPTERFVCR